MQAKRVPFTGPTMRQARELCATAFPPEEQLPFPLLMLNARRANVDFFAYYDEGEFCGIAYCLVDHALVYILYLAVAEAGRSKGYGSQILDDLKQRYPGCTLVLEIESLSESDASNYEQRVRRKVFYERNGFRDAGLREVDYGVPYDILTCGRAITLNDMRELHRKMWLGLHTPDVHDGE